MKQLPPFTMWLEVNNHTGRPKHQQPAQTKSGSLAPGSNTAAQPSQRPALSTISLYIGELSAAFLLGHLSRVSWPLGLAPVLYLHGASRALPCHWSEPGAENTSKGTAALLLLLLLYPRGCTACTAQHQRHALKAELSPCSSTHLCLTWAAQGGAPCQVSPSCEHSPPPSGGGVTSWAQGMPLFAAANSRSRAEHRHCTSLLGWSKRSCQQESSHTADKAWGENWIRDSKKFQTTSSDPALSPFNAKKASIKHVTETWQPRGWSNFTWNNICSLGNYLTENTMTECLWKMWIF